MKRRLIAVLLGLTMILSNAQFVFAGGASGVPQIRNIIYMIPDGGGMAPFFLADHVKQAGGFDVTKYPNATPVEQGEMYIKQYLVGSETTHSANNAVTDSAASGTALSSGYKTNNYMIGIKPNYTPRANILEACQAAGKNTGIVATYEWTNATPAAFGAHAADRNDTLIIGEQIVNQGIDVVFGNTISAYQSQTWFKDTELESRGYDVVKTKEQLKTIQPGDRVWGKLASAYYDVDRAATTPNLAELTEAAIKALDDDNKNGFFLMVEGSAIDGGGHNSNSVQMVSEYLAFDAACKVAIEYAKTRDDTLVVILPDHDTGGIKYGSDYTSGSLAALVDKVRVGLHPSITWEGHGSHTSRNGGIFMYLPEGVSYPEGIDEADFSKVADEFEANFKESTANRIDNITIAPYLAELIGENLDELSNELFVDVTDKGTYDSATEIFTFTNGAGKEVKVKRNTSSATVDGKLVGTDGQVAVYVNNKFYVPAMLLDSEEPEKTKRLSVSANYNTKTVTIKGTTEKPGAYITMLATRPGVGLDDAEEQDGVTYFDQIKSSMFGDYELTFKVNNSRVGDYNYYTRIEDGDELEEYNFSFMNMAVEKDGVVVENMSQLSAGDEIELVLSGYDSSYDGLGIIGQYDEKGVLIGVEYIPVQGEAVSGTLMSDSTKSKVLATVLEGTKTIKAFYMSNDLVPYTGSYDIR